MDYSLVEIREENILALRSFLQEGPEAWMPLQNELRRDDETAAGYMSLLYGAFNLAVRRRFAPTYTIGEIVRFVADLRIRAAGEANPINPLVAEDMIRRALDAPPLKHGGTDDLETVLSCQVFTLLYLVTEADFSRAGLEQFIEQVTAYTEKFLAARQTESSSSPSSTSP